MTKGEVALGLQARPPASRLGQLAWRTSNRLTHYVSIVCGRAIPMLLVAEHPRSGGTWAAHMLADYFQLPFPKYSRLPIACSAIIHTHLWYSPRLAKAVFVKRDGRDLVVSSYFYLLKRIRRLLETGELPYRYLRRYPSLDGATADISDCRERLPGFIHDWWSNPFGCRYNWSDYTMSWTTNAPNVVVTQYESLRLDCVAEMSRIISSLVDSPCDMARLAGTIERFSFETQTGRKPGEEDVTSNKRKGQVGDWHNYFSRVAADAFCVRAGQTLIKQGYEVDDSWVGRCS
jgi:hypothetical protein